MLGDADVATFFIGLAALAIVVVLDRTAIRLVSAVVALVVPTIVMIVAGLDSVARVEDVGDIPRGLPLPQFPDLGLLSFEIVVGALAVAAIVLVQGAGVAQSAPNTGGGIPGRQPGLHRPRHRQRHRRSVPAASPWAARSARPRST